jgi:PAS domain S-box-containing protein
MPVQTQQLLIGLSASAGGPAHRAPAPQRAGAKVHVRPAETKAPLPWLGLLNQAAHIAHGPSGLADAVHAVSALLVSGLRARGVTVWNVVSSAPDAIELRPFDAGASGHPAAAVAPHPRSGLGMAVLQLHATATPAQADSDTANASHCQVALPVVLSGRAMAVIDLRDVPCRADDETLASLLETVQLQLGMVAERESIRRCVGTPFALATPGQADQERLEQEREFLHSLVENMPVSMFVFDGSDRRIVAVNARAEQEFRRPRSELVGRTMAEALGRRVSALVEPAMAEAAARHVTVERNFEFPTSTGLRTVSARYFALRHADGTPRLLIALARDITQQQIAERELQESQAALMEFADVVDESLFVCNPARNRFHFLSASTYDTWGMTKAELAHDMQALMSRVVPEDRSILQERMSRESRLEPVDISVRINHPTKGLRWLRSRTRSRATPDGDVRVYGLVSDVTDDRERELDLQRARDVAQSANDAKSQFMANVSHEIRTPMNGILGMTELLLASPLSNEQKRFVQAVYRSGESLLEIINDILDFSKIEAGKLKLSRIDFSLPALIEDTLELMRPRADEKGLGLSFRMEPGVAERVTGDPLRVGQVLTNLVANAIKFTERGEVTVRLRLSSGKPARFEVSVIDTGIGIDAEMLPRLFCAFTQVSVGMSRRFGGTGLGLTICRQLVELMGGQIGVQSRPGEGSRFSFELPLCAAAGSQDGACETGRPPTSSGMNATSAKDDRLTPRLNAHILVVEDNAVNQEVIGQMLQALGCRVQVCSSAMDGIHALRAGHFDLVLMDIQMPGMDGVEALEAIRGMAPGQFSSCASARAPILAVTANALGGDEARFLSLGFDGYLSKPFRQSQLLAMLTKHISPLAPADAGDSGSPSAPAAVLDTESLNRLRDLDPNGENKLMERVVAAFENSITRLMPQLAEALSSNQLAGIRHVAHTLKSSSASIGALKLSKICADVESKARLQQTDGLAERASELQSEVEVVRVALKHMLKSSP